MAPERDPEAFSAASGDCIEALELPPVVVDEGLGQVLVGVADRIPAVPEAVALHDSLDVDESVFPDRVEPDGVDMVLPGEPAERGVLPDAPEDAWIYDAP